MRIRSYALPVRHLVKYRRRLLSSTSFAVIPIARQEGTLFEAALAPVHWYMYSKKTFFGVPKVLFGRDIYSVPVFKLAIKSCHSSNPFENATFDTSFGFITSTDLETPKDIPVAVTLKPWISRLWKNSWRPLASPFSFAGVLDYADHDSELYRPSISADADWANLLTRAPNRQIEYECRNLPSIEDGEGIRESQKKYLAISLLCKFWTDGRLTQEQQYEHLRLIRIANPVKHPRASMSSLIAQAGCFFIPANIRSVMHTGNNRQDKRFSRQLHSNPGMTPTEFLTSWGTPYY